MIKELLEGKKFKPVKSKDIDKVFDLIKDLKNPVTGMEKADTQEDLEDEYVTALALCDEIKKELAKAKGK